MKPLHPYQCRMCLSLGSICSGLKPPTGLHDKSNGLQDNYGNQEYVTVPYHHAQAEGFHVEQPDLGQAQLPKMGQIWPTLVQVRFNFSPT